MSIKKLRVYRLFKELGAITGIWYVLDKLLRAITKSGFVRRYYIVAQPINVDSIGAKKPPSNILLKTLTNECHDIIDQMPRDNTLLHQRLSEGSFCFYTTKEAKLSGMLWFRKHVYYEDEVSCVYKLSPSDSVVWDFDVFIDKKYRIGVLFYKLWNEAMARLLADDIKYTISRISAFNVNSLRSHQRLGESVMGVVTFVVIKNHQITLFGRWPFILITRSIGDKKPILSIDVDRMDVALDIFSDTHSR